MTPRPRSPLFAVLFFGAAMGALSGYLAQSADAPPPGPDDMRVFDGPEWTMTREPTDPLVVSSRRWQPIAYLFGDFDLSLDVELAEGTEFDLLLRHVEPRPLRGERILFNSRFAVLRLSTAAEGKALVGREEALFGPFGGARVDPGYTTTVLVEARGRKIRAQVAGRPFTPWFEVADDNGSLAAAARGGEALVRALRVTHHGRPSPFPLWIAGLGLGALFAAIGLAFGLCRRVLCASLVPWPIAVDLARRAALHDLLPLTRSDLGSLLWLLLAGLPFALACWAPRRRIWAALLLALVAWCAAVARAALLELPRRLHGQSPLVQFVFGPDSGDGPAEALARRIRGPQISGVHVLPRERERVVMLAGGRLLWDRGRPEEHAEPLLLGGLRAARGQDVQVVSLPTEDGWSLQQWILFDTFYREYAPEVMVFGIPSGEAAEVSCDIDEAGVRRALAGPPVRSLRDSAFAASLARPPGIEGIAALWHRLFSIGIRQRRSNPEVLGATLDALRAWSERSGSRVLLVADAALPAELLAVVRERGERMGAPLLSLSGNDRPRDVAEKLLEAVLALLP